MTSEQEKKVLLYLALASSHNPYKCGEFWPETCAREAVYYANLAREEFRRHADS